MKRKLGLVILSFILLAVFPGTFAHGETYREPYFATDYDFLEPYMKVMAADENLLWAAGGHGKLDMKILYSSSDYGHSWTRVQGFDKSIEAIHITYNNTIFISLSNGRWSKEANGEILRSDDGGRTFESVLHLETGAAYIWNIASDDQGYVYVSEYGNKSLPDNARRIYGSSDGGITWKKLYEPDATKGYHNHVISIDKNDNRVIYQVVGDDNKAILRSQDRGETWEEMITGKYHPTSVVQIGDEILWGLDCAPKSGVIRYNTNREELDYAFETPKPLGGSTYDMLYVNDVIYAGFLSYSNTNNPWDASIFVSQDQGETWSPFVIWPKYGESGIGFYKFTAQGDYGFIYGTFPVLKNNRVETFHGTIRFELLNIMKSSWFFSLNK